MRHAILVFIAVSASAAAQTSTSESRWNDTQRIISEALTGCVRARDEAYGSMSDTPYPVDGDILVEERAYKRLRNVPATIEGHRIEYLAEYEVRQRARHERGVAVMVVNPIFVDGDEITINFDDVWARWDERGSYQHPLSGGCIARFVLSEESRRFEFADAETWGI